MNRLAMSICVTAALGVSMQARAAGGGAPGLQEQIDALNGRVAALESKLAGVSRNGDTLVFNAMNLQIVNGLGSTDGDFGFGPWANGLGNLIVGYDEVTEGCTNDCELKTGSHSIIVGARHEYTSYGSVVFGLHHRVNGVYASALGGTGHVVTGDHATVSGGQHGAAVGTWTSVFGGEQNIAAGDWATAVGGYFNHASGYNATTLGGDQNESAGSFSVTTGGFINTAQGSGSVVSGGYERTAADVYDWVAGGLLQDD